MELKDPLGMSAHIVEAPADPGGGEGQEQNPLAESEAYHRRQGLLGRYEKRFESQILAAEKPSDIIEGTRRLMAIYENEAFKEGQDVWGTRNIISTMVNRRDYLFYSPKSLEEMGKIKDYDPNTGMAEAVTDDAANYAIKERTIGTKPVPTGFVKKQDGSIEQTFSLIPDTKLFIGTETDREENYKALDKALLEINTRVALATLDQEFFDKFRDDLNGLTTYLYQRAPKFKVEHLQEFFNLPGVSEANSNIENTEFGQQIEKSLLWLLCIYRSSTKEKMMDFLSRPGVQDTLFPKRDKTKPIFQDASVVAMVGDVPNWVEDKDRILDGEKTTKQEATAVPGKPYGVRGELTRFGNILVTEGIFFGKKDEQSLMNTIARLVSRTASKEDMRVAREAVDLAVSFAKVTGLTADEGVELLPNGEWSLKLGQNIKNTSNDLAKIFHPDVYTIKEGSVGRVFGPLLLAGQVRRMALPFLKQQSVRFGDGRTRSFMDAWLGFSAEKVHDRVNNQEVDMPAEPYTRLGALDWGSLPHDAWNAYANLMWLAARDDRGVFDYFTTIDVDPRRFTEKGLRMLRKYVDIIHFPMVLLDGESRGQGERFDPATHQFESHGKSLGAYKKEQISEILGNYLAGMMSLPSWATTVGSASVKVWDERTLDGLSRRMEDIVFEDSGRLGYGTEFKVEEQEVLGGEKQLKDKVFGKQDRRREELRKIQERLRQNSRFIKK